MLLEIVLLVPHAKSDCIQRISVNSDSSFDEVLTLIYKAVPCNDESRKPDLSYKLSSVHLQNHLLSVLPMHLIGLAVWTLLPMPRLQKRSELDQELDRQRPRQF
jgi:hypothetical protein